ncbi:MAG: response regulator transcription factor [Salinivirgaceae bacterium]|jgi:DNA-binding NarL/FixJ family response regulator|nr:response regulator transcription factor [Salinivirgaceae bacterium]
MKIINKVIVVDDHDIFREGLVSLLKLKKIARTVDEARNGQEFLDLLNKREIPDLVLLDISMPIMDGVIAAQAAVEKFPSIKIIVLSMFGDKEYYYKMISAGVKGFVLKSSGKNELESAILNVMEGNSFFSNELLIQIIADIGYKSDSEKKQTNEFTPREYDVLKLFCQGLSAKEIADQMALSKKTIEGYRTKLFHKTGTKTSTSLVVYAIKNKIVSIV